uniref:Uncharacterized protein n=1 Tax=viral metagenome TaxID=1070528 RepID=A0A6M3IND1_9ZZZZ
MDGLNALIAQGRPAPTFDLMRSTANALTLKNAQRQSDAYPAEQEWQQKVRGRQEQQWGIDDKKRAMDENQQELTNFATAAGLASKSSDPETGKRIMAHFGYEDMDIKFDGENVTFGSVDGDEITGPKSQLVPFWESIKNGDIDLNDPKQAMSARAWMGARGITWKQAKEKDKEPKALKSWAMPDGKILNLPNNVAPPAGAVPYSSGMDIEVTPEGTRIRTGVGPKDMTRKSQGDIETKIITGKEQIARIQAIASEFKPEFQEIGARLATAWTSIKAKLGQNVSKDDSAKLVEFKKFQRKAIENINLYIKELTGAQMSEKEADRLRLAQPDPGENWWSGDDPITFKAKMDDVEKMARASVARYEYYRSKGLSHAIITEMVKSGVAESLETIASRMK